MELDGTNVVKMTKKSEQASSQLIVPNFDLVIIPYKWIEKLENYKIKVNIFFNLHFEPDLISNAY